MRVVSFLIVTFMSVFSFAAIDRQRATIDKKHRYIENGIVFGGEAADITSLLSVRRFFAPTDKIERIILDVGDAAGRPLRNRVGYFHVSLDRAAKRVTVMLDQTTTSGVNAEQLRDIFKASPNVRDTRISFDPVDKGITIELWLKRSAMLEAFQLPSTDKASRIVIDLKQQGV